MAQVDARAEWSELKVLINSAGSQLVQTPTAFLYFLTVMILGGAAGIWVPFLSEHGKVGFDAFSSYVFAVLSPIIADLLLKPAEDGKQNFLLRGFVLFFSAIAYSLAIITLIRNDEWAWFSGVYAFFLSIVIYIVIIKADKRFSADNDNEPINLVGGTVSSTSSVSSGGSVSVVSTSKLIGSGLNPSSGAA
ncbi:MAG: hypothetical protein PHU23_16010 [Dehalococcoidales bacterium]|nr:hypothetical protein [Dehalococcoidales bacterium]